MSAATATHADLLRTPRIAPAPSVPAARIAPLRALPAPRPIAPSGARVAVKHAFDFAVALGGLLLLAPVLLVVALAVKASSPGPVLYRQRRIGRDGRAFDILKFRSMRPEGARRGRVLLGLGSAPGGVEGTDRRTRVGRLLRASSIDELPQLINVVRGEMSLVGPRPERPEFVELFCDEVPGYADRHRMRVGMTGLAQVRGLRGKTSIAHRAEADNEYIDSWSIRKDLAVLGRTVRVVLARDAE